MKPPQRIAAAALAGLLGLQWLWHAWLAPPERAPAWAVALLFSLPLLAPAMGFMRRRGSAAMWAGTVALFYFCHGVAEAWASPSQRALALAEVGLALALVFASSWAGLQARVLRRKAAPPNV